MFPAVGAGKDSLLCGIGGQMNRAVITVILKNRLSKDAESNESQGQECIGTAEEEDIDLFSTYAESEENQEEEDPGTAEEEDTREEKDKESYSDGSEEEEATCKKLENERRSHAHFHIVTRRLFTCRSTSGMFMTGRKNMRRTALSRFKLRKEYEFTSQELLLLEICRAKPKPKESTSCKNPHRKRKLCPLPGCMVSTERLPQHLQRRHKLKRDDAKYKKALSMAKVVSAKRSHVFLRIKEESNKATNPESNFTLEDKEFTNDHENSEDEHSMHSKAPDFGDEGMSTPCIPKRLTMEMKGVSTAICHSKGALYHGDEGGEHSMRFQSALNRGV
ncbi:hypothetical protein OS493_032498 [Desmophyllum pertusum]|uniref:Uncharacterized protein n=1 Tax=Desmophyllum pertusum TaxID=174260 RepID=A0A9W9Z8I4_9CNID|nr:hypothetical protein OS493_032498 [Desmophyllum pertusum]